jgi:hypothetical protein
MRAGAFVPTLSGPERRRTTHSWRSFSTSRTSLSGNFGASRCYSACRRIGNGSAPRVRQDRSWAQHVRVVANTLTVQVRDAGWSILGGPRLRSLAASQNADVLECVLGLRRLACGSCRARSLSGNEPALAGSAADSIPSGRVGQHQSHGYNRRLSRSHFLVRHGFEVPTETIHGHDAEPLLIFIANT